MSMEQKEKVTCPACGRIGSVAVQRSIDADGDQEIKEKVKAQKLFTYTCPCCGAITPVSCETVYHDKGRRLMVHVVKDDAGEQAAARYFSRLRNTAAAYDGYCFRIVRSAGDLAEKVCIADAGLDDRLVELFKILTVRQLAARQPDAAPSSCRFGFDEDGMAAFILSGGSEEGGVRMEGAYRKLYDAAGAAYAADLGEYSRGVYVIDRSWAETFLHKVMEKKS